MTLPTLILCGDPSRAAEAAADVVRAAAHAAIKERGVFRWALAGGGTPRRLYQMLAEQAPGFLPWADIELYFGDERAVPPDDEGSNYRMVQQALLEAVAPRAVFRIEGELGAEAAAARYREVVTGPLDLVLLGMGGDGHTASLFPDTPALRARGRVVASRAPVAPHERVSLTFDAINEARLVVLLVTGEAKAERLVEVHGEIEREQPVLPLAMVQPAGQYLWIVDEAAAARLIKPELQQPGRDT